MKTKFFLLMGLLVFAGIVWSQNESRQSKAAAKEAKVKKTVETERYRLILDQARPMRGNMIPLTSEYTLTIAQDSAISYLPYFGRAYSAPIGSEGGIKFSEPVLEKKTTFNAKNKSFTVSFKVRAKEDTYRFFVSIWLNGTTTVSVTSNNRQAIDFSGTIELPDK